ncbi:Jag family protein [Collinsella provencensis]|uniref:Jag family protein n=1 Tax=Collinsella provencensis TaxID=1937461 RepID=UPI000C82EDD2|nr:R3H domain-containing nucleic acid-binding protein [Collinsella provencensis]
MAEELVEEIAEEAVVEEQIVGEYPEIAKRYKAGEDLTDEDLDTIADVAISIVRDILVHFDADNSPIDEYEGDEGELILDITAPDLAVLIGRHGRTLESLQTLVSLLVSRKLGFRYPVAVDVEGYKSRRHDKVISMAKSAASRAVSQNRTVNLPPMTAYERRLVHIALREDDRVDTHSEGTDPERRVVITVC